METMTRAGMEWETIDRDQVIEIMEGKQPSPPKDYSHNLRENQSAPAEAGQPENAQAAEGSLSLDKETGSSRPDTDAAQ